MMIAIDLMGGDKAPKSVIEGVKSLLLKESINLVLVGDKGLLEQDDLRFLSKYNVEIIHTREKVLMNDDIMSALKNKPDSSIALALKLLKDGKVNSVVSAGSSGATLAYGVHFLGKLDGIKRPALISHFPTKTGSSVMLDIGANVDSTGEHLTQFARLGACYGKVFLKREKPKVALLSNGNEPIKGNRALKEADTLLKNSSNINYKGFIEASSIYSGQADVIVCDGFIGNVVLKSTEALLEILREKVTEDLKDYRKDDKLMNVLKNSVRDYYFSKYGGAILLGLKGLCMICHGASSPKTIENAIFQTKGFSDMNFSVEFEREFKRFSTQ